MAQLAPSSEKSERNGAVDVDPYAQHTAFTVLEFGASHGSGSIGTLVQQVIGELAFGTLKPHRGE